MLNTDTFDPAATARRLLSEARTGALATAQRSGAPYASLVTVATLPDIPAREAFLSLCDYVVERSG